MKRQIADVLPLTPRAFHILLALVDGSANGYRIMVRAEENSGGRVRIGPGTLYEALHRLTQQGFLEEVTSAGGRVDGRGQRFYK